MAHIKEKNLQTSPTRCYRQQISTGGSEVRRFTQRLNLWGSKVACRRRPLRSPDSSQSYPGSIPHLRLGCTEGGLKNMYEFWQFFSQIDQKSIFC